MSIENKPPSDRARNIELKQLRFFVRVVDLGSITRASHVLHIAQPALSKHISDLEHALGASLLVRGPQGTQTTEQGRALYAAAQRILRDVEAVALEVAAIGNEPVGTVRFGLPETTSLCLAYPLVARMLECHPHINLVMVAGLGRDLYRRLLHGDLDLIIHSSNEEIGGVQSLHLVDEELFVVQSIAADELDDGDPTIDLQTLAELPMLMPATPDSSMQSLMRAMAEVASQRLNVTATADSLALAKQLMLNGHGCVILPWIAVQDELEAGSVRLRRVTGHRLSRRLSLCRLADQRATAAIDAVTAMTSEIVAQLIDGDRWLHTTRVAGARWS
jgi:LysR family nitrogen assimilation transcriptional regulator